MWHRQNASTQRSEASVVKRVRGESALDSGDRDIDNDGGVEGENARDEVGGRSRKRVGSPVGLE